MKKLVIHIGACKTGSTTLQRSLFAQHPNLEYIGEDGDGYEGYQKEFLNALYMDDAFLNSTPIDSLVQQKIDGSDKKTLIISSEDIVVSPAFSQCMRRMCKYAPDPTVLLVIRNQLSALQSYYAGHGAFLRPSPRPHFKRYVPMTAWLEYNFDITPYGPVTSYNYWKIVKAIEKMVGKEQIKILMFEDFISDRKLFCSQLGAAIGVDAQEVFDHLDGSHERPRVSKRWHHYVRFRSKFLWGVSCSRYFPRRLRQCVENFLLSGPKCEVSFPQNWERRVFDYYAQGNRELADAYDLDLEKYNYPIVK